jgi:hypothetical protein
MYAVIQDLLEQLGVAERLRGESPPACRAAADAVVHWWKELERVQAEDRPPPSGSATTAARRPAAAPAVA